MKNNPEFHVWIDRDTLSAIAEVLVLKGEGNVKVVGKGLYGLGACVRGNEEGRRRWFEGWGDVGLKVGEGWGHDERIMDKLLTLAGDVVREGEEMEEKEAIGGENGWGWRAWKQQRCDVCIGESMRG